MTEAKRSKGSVFHFKMSERKRFHSEPPWESVPGVKKYLANCSSSSTNTFLGYATTEQFFSKNEVEYGLRHREKPSNLVGLGLPHTHFLFSCRNIQNPQFLLKAFGSGRIFEWPLNI